ncbi:MAG: hypothetical protein KGQ59_08215, partial [Bdellovibrionales bacterium]|nr:hypothetical protein [Bdellovibrionales bacterium]
QKVGKFTLFEGYPSLLWRTLAQKKTRAPEKLAEWLKNQSVEFRTSDARRFRSDPDLADAVMLAVGGALLQKQGRLLQPFPGFFQSTQYLTRAQVEGWIAGLPQEL